MPGPIQFTADMLASAMSGEGLVETAPVAPPRKPVQKSKLTPKNVVALAKARLKDVKAELRRMKALEKERAELERLIDAAENKPIRVMSSTAGQLGIVTSKRNAG